MTAPTEAQPVPRLAYSPAEAAEALSISLDHMRKAIRAGVVRHSRIGRRIIIPADEVQRIADQGLAMPDDPRRLLYQITYLEARKAEAADPAAEARAAVEAFDRAAEAVR